MRVDVAEHYYGLALARGEKPYVSPATYEVMCANNMADAYSLGDGHLSYEAVEGSEEVTARTRSGSVVLLSDLLLYPIVSLL